MALLFSVSGVETLFVVSDINFSSNLLFCEQSIIIINEKYVLVNRMNINFSAKINKKFTFGGVWGENNEFS